MTEIRAVSQNREVALAYGVRAWTHISTDTADDRFSYQDRNQQITCEAIAALPYCLCGKEALAVFNSAYRDDALMYDFINIFTEHAKTLPTRQKIEVETNAGTLAAWISKNKRKFV